MYIAIFIVVGALSPALASPAFAQFSQADLTGNWTFHGLETSNDETNTLPATWLRGAITVLNTGAVLPGTLVLTDGSTRALTTGKLALQPTGVITGTLTVAGTVVNVRATMTPDKNGVVGVADDARHVRDQTFALVRQTALNFSTSDLAGQWLVYGLGVPAIGTGGGAGTHGVLTFDDTGAFSTLRLTPPDGGTGFDRLNGGSFTISSAGDVQGSLTGGTDLPPSSGLVIREVTPGVSPPVEPTALPITYAVSGVMEPGRTVIVGVITRDLGGSQSRMFFVALKSNADALAIADLAGTWRSYVHLILQDNAPLGSWLEGPLTIRATDGAVSGSLRNADGSGATITGTLAVNAGGEPDNQLSGDLVVHLPVPGLGTIPLPGTLQGRVSPARDRIGSTIFINVVGPGGSATIHALAILVRPPVSTVQFAAPSYTARENGGTAQITLSRSGTAGGVSVEWATTTGGSATAGDYTAASGTLTFPAGATTASFPITINDNFVLNPNKTVNLVLRNPQGGAVIGPRSTAQLTILDDEQVVQFAAASASVTANEGATVTLTLTRTGLLGTAFTVPVTIDGGSAVSGVDYPTSLAPLAVAFGAGDKSKTFSVPLLRDGQQDGVKTLRLRLGTPSAPNVLLGAEETQTSTLTIVDNESGVVKFGTAASSVVEGNTAKIAVTRSGTNLQGGITIEYAVVVGPTGGTASPDDYTLLGGGTLTFGPRQTTQTILVQTTQDTIAEPSETVIIQLSNPQGLAVLAAPPTHTLTIKDNDNAGVLHFKTAAVSVPEPPGASGLRNVPLDVVRDGTNLASGVTVDFAVTGGNAVSLGAGTLTFNAGEKSPSLPISLVIQADDVPEGNETIVVTLSNPQPQGLAKLGNPTVMTITIVDDERAVYFAADTLTVNETTRTVAITLLRSGDASGGCTVPVLIGASSTAVAGQDYPAAFTATATFRPRQTATTVTIPLLNDTIVDGQKTLVLELGTPAPIAPAVDAPGIGTRRSMKIFLNDDDKPGQIGFAAASSVVSEGGTLKIPVNRTGTNLAGGVTVDYGLALTATPPTADADSDFTGATGTLIFGPGATSALITINTLRDSVKELPEKFTLELSNPRPLPTATSPGATLIPGRTLHVVTINDTTQAGVIQWAATAVSANEEGAAVTLTIKRTGTNLAQDISVSYAVDAGSTATPNVDYTITSDTGVMGTPGTVTFGAGETTRTLMLTPVNDDLVEPTESIRITLSSPTGGATLGANKTVVVNLVDGTERFNGFYTGTFTGSFQQAGSTSGTETFSVNNTAISVSQICAGGQCDSGVSGNGQVSFDGNATFTFTTALVPDSTCTFTGRFSASGTTAGASGTWTCPSLSLGQGRGTWRATRTP